MRYPNFYETIDEARMRLRDTIILYYGVPYLVFALLTNSDGIFRVVLRPIGLEEPMGSQPWPDQIHHYNYNTPECASYVGSWLASNPELGWIMPKINDDGFDCFRPFPLGMCNAKSGLIYTERQPTRKVEQGLIRSMVIDTRVTFDKGSKALFNGGVNLFGPEFRATIVGEYPSAQECLEGLLNPNVKTEAAAFHREFALIRGPMQTTFLVYKRDVVAALPNKDFSVLQLGSEFKHLQESITELELFQSIIGI